MKRGLLSGGVTVAALFAFFAFTAPGSNARYTARIAGSVTYHVVMPSPSAKAADAAPDKKEKADAPAPDLSASVAPTESEITEKPAPVKTAKPVETPKPVTTPDPVSSPEPSETATERAVEPTPTEDPTPALVDATTPTPTE